MTEQGRGIECRDGTETGSPGEEHVAKLRTRSGRSERRLAYRWPRRDASRHLPGAVGGEAVASSRPVCHASPRGPGKRNPQRGRAKLTLALHADAVAGQALGRRTAGERLDRAVIGYSTRCARSVAPRPTASPRRSATMSAAASSSFCAPTEGVVRLKWNGGDAPLARQVRHAPGRRSERGTAPAMACRHLVIDERLGCSGLRHKRHILQP
jgi:hypothetical protein